MSGHRMLLALTGVLLLLVGPLQAFVAAPESHAGLPFTQGEEAYIIHVNGIGVIYSKNDTPLINDKQALVNRGWSIVYALRWGVTPNAEAQSLFHTSAQEAGASGITLDQAMHEVVYAQTDLSDGSCPSPGGKWRCSTNNKSGIEYSG